ncbi:MAG: sn-glycerol-3-phosphate ABC transporter ATP-binding protein UgpC [Kiloniellales bacterium]|nr:sn-glycerol-3-phosphate ABC transporter ATP-binding protein UgpC [Kiloniellales bacterium]
MAEVRLDGVDKSYGTVQVLFDVSLTVAEGEFMVFVGPSGCGKSTLLRAIAGLEEIAKGTIHIDGVEVTQTAPAERGVAMVFQSYALYPHMSVRGNMEFGLKVNRAPKPEIEARIREAARILQLEDYLDRRPGQLSGGQRQRVAIGRAIVKQPKVFLFDEPLSNLDAALRIQMRVELESLHETLGSTMIYVTHDQVEAMTMADKIVVLNEGRVEQVGAPLDLYHRPQTRFVAGFLGAPSMNFLPGRLAGAEGGHVSVGYGPAGRVAVAGFAPGPSEGDVTLGIRPEHLAITEAERGQIRAKVHVVEALGSESYVHADSEAGDRIVVEADGDTPVKRGEVIGLSCDPVRCHLFGTDGLALPRIPEGGRA